MLSTKPLKILAAVLLFILFLLLGWRYFIFQFDKLEDICEQQVSNRLTQTQQNELIQITDAERTQLKMTVSTPTRFYYEVNKCLYYQEYFRE